MSLWNPLNVFSTPERDATHVEPSGSFDPSRTGDPVGPGSARPAIGYGQTSVSSPAVTTDPARRPIGFAPPDDDVEQRYHTEISFKRHHEAPRASAAPDGTEEGPSIWETPSVGFAESDTPADTIEHPNVESESAEKVPFFKREISFRRKKTEAEAEAEAVPVSGEDDAETDPFDPVATDEMAEVNAAAEPQVEVVATATVDHDDPDEAESTEAEPAELHADAGPVVEAEDVTDAVLAAAVVSEASEERVSFLKREISFRRRPTPPVAEPAFDEDHAFDESEEEVFDRMPATAAAAAATVESAGPDDRDVESSPSSEAEEPAEIVEATAAEPERAVSDSEEVAGQAEEPVAADEPVENQAGIDAEPDSEPEPVAEVIEEPEAGAELPAAVVPEPRSNEPDELPGESADGDMFIEDTEPDAKGRFSRKGKGADKAPKRKPTRGGKGGKGRRVVGLKIGASQIAAAVVTEGEAGPELLDLARRPLPAGIVVVGEIRDVDALANALKAFFDEEKLPKKDVRIGLASNRIGVRTFDIVGIDDESRFDNAVRFKAHEVLPVAAHESVLDYRVLEERPNEAGEPSRRVLLVVAPRDQVEPYVEVARRAGIKLAGLDLEALGLLRAFVDPKPFAARAIDDTATVIVSIGHESSTLLVAGGGACEFTRVFDWGGGSLEEAIATALEVRPAEAATILRHLSLSGPGRQLESLDEADRAKALDAVRLRLTPFARELVSSLQFYQTQDDSLGIGGIVITGGTSQLEGLGDALYQMIGVNVTVGDPLGRVTTTGEFTPAIEAALGSLAVPIGLAVDDLLMRSVDLLPKDAIETKSRRATLVPFVAPIAVAVPLVALGFMYLGAHGQVSDKSSELESVKAEIAALPKPQGPKIDAGVVGDEATRATAVASVLGGRLAWDDVFGDLARVMPDNVWLKSLSASLPETAAVGSAATTVTAAAPGTATPAPTAVVIEGYTYTQPDVARLLARLATLPSLARVTLTSSQGEVLAKKNVVHFVVVADLSQTGGAS